MDMAKKAADIFNMSCPKTEKIKQLQDLLTDCLNEMEAQDQNMHPEMTHNNAEGYRMAKNFLRELKRH